MDKGYYVVVRQGAAEFKALKNSKKEILDSIIPIIEITKGRRKTVNEVVTFPLDPYMEKIKEIFKDRVVCLDVTTNEALTSKETADLYNPSNGYENWVEFLVDLKNQNVFKKIIPVVLLNYNDSETSFEVNLKKEIQRLREEFGTIAYRNDIADEAFYDDLEYLEGDDVWYILDCGYIPQSASHNAIQKCIARLTNIKTKWPRKFNKMILVSTSFPNNLSEIVKEGREAFDLSEIRIFEEVKKDFPSIEYGDYGSLNPIRNDKILMTRGWVPHIEVPLQAKIFMYREKRPKEEKSYSSTYGLVARQCFNDPDYPQNLDDSWGLRQIQLAAEGFVPASSPSFWIGVRMNIHLQQQLERLKSNNYYISK